MGRRGKTKQVIRALKDWIKDTPLQIAGWIMSLIASIAGLIILSFWLQQHFPPYYVWIGFALTIFGIIMLSFIPYYKRTIRPHLGNRAPLIRAIGIFGQKAKNLIYKQENLYWMNVQSTHLVQVEHMIERDNARVEYDQAVNQLENEILVAGKDFEEPLQMFFTYIKHQVFLRLWQNPPEIVKPEILSSMELIKQIDLQVKVTIKRIEEISQ
jgi:hypothetical protein